MQAHLLYSDTLPALSVGDGYSTNTCIVKHVICARECWPHKKKYLSPKFQNFQGPQIKFTDFQGLEVTIANFKTFKNFQGPREP